MRNIILILTLIVSSFLQAQNEIPKLDWIHSISESSHGLSYAVTLDNSGNVLISGHFENTVDFDPGPGVTNLTSSGEYDVFVSKYTNNGGFLWAKSMGGYNDDYGYGVETDLDNNVIITGVFRGNGDFDPGPGINMLTCQNNFYGNSFIVKLDSLGDHIWSKGLTSVDVSSGNEVAADNLGNVYATGTFQNTIDLDPGIGVHQVVSEGGSDLYLIKFDPSGNYLTGIRQGGDTHDEAHDIKIDDFNNVYLGGRYSDTVDFDPGPGTYTMIGEASYNSFVEKLDENLDFQWVKAVESSYINSCHSIALNDFGHLYMTGYFTWTADMNTGAGSTIATSNGNKDVYILKLDTDGNFYWVRNFGGSAADQATGISCDQNGTPYVTGSFVGYVDFDPGPGTDYHMAQGPIPGYHDLWVEKIDTSGNVKWVFTSGNASGINSCRDIEVDDSARIFMAGYNNGTIDWAPGAEEVLINSDGVDAYIHVLYQCDPGLSVDVQTACDQFTWMDGNTYTSSNNTATHTILNGAANGCDSIITLDLTMTYSTSSTDIRTACSSFTWIDGNTYTSSTNSPTWTIPNSIGCDSVITLNLTILDNFGTDVVYACGSYQWIDGITYTSSNNTATQTLTNAAGCDSVVTLDLTIGNPTVSTDIVTACDYYTWIDGNTYTSDNNTATHTLTSITGCDSLVMLDLTILNSTAGTDVQTACDYYTWIDGITYTSDNNIATHTLTNAIGCDSVVTLDLTILNSTAGTDVQIACDSFTWIDGNTYTSDNNTATYTLTNAVGCDSIVTLDLIFDTFVVTATQLDDVTIEANTVGTSYQWLDCNDNYSPISGETDQLFEATINGSYAVEVTENNCKDTSDCFVINSVELEKQTKKQSIKLFPNPTTGKLLISLDGIKPGSLTLTNTRGQILKTLEMDKDNIELDISSYSPGVYFLNIDSEKGNIVKRIVKK